MKTQQNGMVKNQELVTMARRFEYLSSTLRSDDGYRLYGEKPITWIGAKSRRKLGKNVNYYAFERRDFSQLNELLNRIYLKEQKLKTVLNIEKIDEIENFRRYVIFGRVLSDKENFDKINKDLKKRLVLSHKKIDGILDKAEKFSINDCFSLWFQEYQQIIQEDKFKEMDKFVLENYISFNVAFQFAYDCSCRSEKVTTTDFLNMIENINALSFGKEYMPYRQVRAFITQGNWLPIECEEIYPQLQVLADWVVNDKASICLHPIEVAAILNCEIIRLQAFPDRNHRTARLATTEILVKANIPPIAIDLQQRDKYNELTNKGIENHEIDDLIGFIYNEVYKNAIKIEQKLDKNIDQLPKKENERNK